jgi:hypothetical protein
MGLVDVVEDLGGLVTDVGKDVGETVVDAVDVFGATPLIGLVNPGLGILAQLDEVIGLGGQLVSWANETGLNKLLLAADSPILAAGQAVIADMRETTGTGEPEVGDRLGDGEQRFHQATDVLKTAHPGGDWAGSGSDAYSAADTRQAGRTNALADLDRQLREVIAREAGQLERTRDKLDDESNGLAEFGLTTFGFGRFPGVGQALKQAAELQAVMKALSACSAELQRLSSEVSANAAAVQRLVGQYTGAARGAGHPDGIPAPGGSYRGPLPPGTGPVPGGGSGSGGGSPSAGTPSRPDVPTPTMPETPTSDGASDSSGGVLPGGLGGSPSGAGGSPSGSGAGGGGLASLIGEMIKAATQNSSDPKTPEEEAAEKKKQEEQAAKDAQAAEAAKEAEDAEAAGEPVAAPGDVQGGRAPIHVELDVDPARLDQPMTVTLDRDHPIVLPPATTTQQDK